MDSKLDQAPQRLVSNLLMLGVALFYLTQLGSYGLLEPDEGRYAEIAREMAQPGGDWIIPRLNGIPHFQKPPIFYWFTAASIKIFGVNEMAARLPVALSALFTLFLTMGISRRLFGENAARISLLILASTPLFLMLGRTITPDMTMTMWITSAIYCLVRARESRRWQWLFFVCAGLGFLTKGPVSFVVPFSAAIGYSIALKKTGAPRLSLPWLFGIPLAVLIGLSWFFIAAAQYPELAGYFWKYEFVERFTSSTHGRSRPFWFFIPVLIGGFLPWALPALRQLVAALKQRSAEFGLLSAWLIIPFLILSMSGSKLPTYVLPLFPALAVALGAAFSSATQNGNLASFLPKSIRVAMALCLVAISVFYPIADHFVVKPSLAISASMYIWTALFSLAAIVWLVRGWNHSGKHLVLSYACLALLIWLPLPSHIFGWNDLLKQQACVETLAKRILTESADDEKPPRVISCEIRANGLEFYLGQTVEITRGTADIAPTPEDSRLSREITTVLHKKSNSVSKLKSGQGIPIYVVTRKNQYERDFKKREWTLLQTAGDFVLLRR